MTAKKSKNTKKSQATPKQFRERMFESDGTYFLKLVVVVLLGTFWIKFEQPVEWLGIPVYAVPVGVLIGLLMIRAFEHYQSDRKIWYAVLIVVGIVCSFAPAGVVI